MQQAAAAIVHNKATSRVFPQGARTREGLHEDLHGDCLPPQRGLPRRAPGLRPYYPPRPPARARGEAALGACQGNLAYLGRLTAAPQLPRPSTGSGVHLRGSAASQAAGWACRCSHVCDNTPCAVDHTPARV